MTVLLAAASGERRGGGVFVVSDGGAERLDKVATIGMSVSPDGTRLVRSLRTDQSAVAGGELLISDRRGVVAYHRLDDGNDIHEVLARDDDILVVSTGTNAIVAVDGAGREQTFWQAPGTGDAWHLNSLILHHGRLLASAFGRFDHHRDWASHDAGGTFAAAGRGEVFDVASGAPVLSGLSMPHDPRPVDGGWLVCESLLGAVVRFDEYGQRVRSVQLDGFTRGVQVDGEVVHVGVSANRHVPGAGVLQAEVVTLGVDDFSVQRRVALAADEVSVLLAVSDDLAGGVAVGMRTNRGRAREQARWALFDAMGLEPDHLWTDGDRLAPERWRARLAVDDAPTSARAGSRLTLRCTVENTAGVPLASILPFPVRVGGCWIDSDGTDEAQSAARADLPGTLAPGQEVELSLDVPVPGRPGRWELRVGVLQELVAWFAATDPSAEVVLPIEVMAG